MRSTWDVFAPVAGILGVVVLFSAASEVSNANQEMSKVARQAAVVVRYEDVLPFSTQKPSRFGFKYPWVKYDRDGKPREEGIYYARVSPSHFKIGQEVSIGKIEGRLVILDRWYIWQEHITYIVMSLAGVVCTFCYYVYWRPTLVAREQRPNKAPEPTPGSVTPRASSGESK